MSYDPKKRYKYYFSSITYHPWSFEGIMSDIQHALYNNEGLTEDQIRSNNLINRINSLSGEKRSKAYAELEEAKAMAARREAGKEKASKIDAQEKEDAISNYRYAWKRTGFFFKIGNKRKNPKNIDFDNLSVEEIESRRRRLGKR